MPRRWRGGRGGWGRGWWYLPPLMPQLPAQPQETQEAIEEKERGYQSFPAFVPYMWGPGYNRMLRAMQVGDPERALFGLGPCGEIAYRMYKGMKKQGKQ